MKLPLSSICLLLLLPLEASAQPNFLKVKNEFLQGYGALHLPDLELSFVSNLQAIKPAAEIQKQLDFFNSIKAQLPACKNDELSRGEMQDYNLIAYETNINLQRLALEQEWVKNPPKTITVDGLHHLPNGKAWYAYFLKRWLSADVTPDEIYQFGLSEVERVSRHIEAIRKQTGMTEDAFYRHLNDSSFFIKDPKTVQQSFERVKSIIYANMPRLFNVKPIHPLKIERGGNQALAQTPGYYDDNTFYYNLFNKPYNKRQVDWLFIHEAVPGHHYQSSTNAQIASSAVQKLFFYIGFAEGWAAYTEELGKELGVYQTPYDELGKWEWDIVRSVRVPLDVGINYYGWTDEQALAFWKAHIRNQDDIAMREIARIKRWPVQVITYKYGALQILRWKADLQKKQGKAFDIRDFHDRILNYGSLPVFMVKENVYWGR